MAKMFYSAEEAAKKLGLSEEEVKKLVREGKLREFRDAGTVNYKVEDVEGLAKTLAPAQREEPPPSESSASASGDILLEPVEDSSVDMSPAGSDVIGLDESDAASGTSSGTAAAEKSKEDTVVPSVGVNVFDDDELDEHVDPLAQTAVTDVAGLGLEGMGSGSGILDLTRESDDTSLGRELLDEIYTGEGEQKEEAPVEMGEDTRAGLEEALPEEPAEKVAEPTASATTVPALAEERAVGAAVSVAAETGGVTDALSSALTALLVVALAIMWVCGLATAALVRGVTPSLLEVVYANLWIYAAGSLAAALAAGAATFFVVKKRSG